MSKANLGNFLSGLTFCELRHQQQIVLALDYLDTIGVTLAGAGVLSTAIVITTK